MEASNQNQWMYGRIILLFLMSAVTMMACSPAKGREFAQRQEILAELRRLDFTFDDTLISTVADGNDNRVIISGPMAKRVPDHSVYTKGIAVSEVHKLVMNRIEGKWVVVSD